MNEGDHTISASPEGADHGPRTRLVALLTGPSLAIGALGTLLIASWLSRLPDPVATHWSTDGPDGYSTQGVVLYLPLAIGVVGAVIGLAAWTRVRESAVARMVVGVLAGISGSTVAVIVACTAVQRGVDDARSVATPTLAIGIAMAAGLAVGVLAALAVPRWSVALPDSDVGRRPVVSIGATERFVWTRTMTMSSAASAVVGAAIVIVAGLGVALRSWLLGAVLVVVLLAVIAVWSVRVTIDRSGVVMRGGLGWPRLHMRAEDIDHAEVVEVRALRDFGGYGYRVALRGELSGAKGFVLRSGTGILVVRRDGGREVFVVDDARTGAGVINHLSAGR